MIMKHFIILIFMCFAFFGFGQDYKLMIENQNKSIQGIIDVSNESKYCECKTPCLQLNYCPGRCCCCGKEDLPTKGFNTWWEYPKDSIWHKPKENKIEIIENQFYKIIIIKK